MAGCFGWPRRGLCPGCVLGAGGVGSVPAVRLRGTVDGRLGLLLRCPLRCHYAASGIACLRDAEGRL